MISPPTGTVTFLFTDIEGSTKLWENHPAAMKVDLARHDELLRRAIEANAGYVFKTVGDAFCAAFAAPSEAVSASLDIQQTLRSEEWQVPNDIKVRIALHVGEVESRDEDYFGPTVNRVARLLSSAHGGQIWLSAATTEVVKDTLQEGLSLLALGSHRLKDLSQPQQVYQLIHPDLTTEFPALTTLDNHPNNLTPQPTQLIGREIELTGILKLIRQESVRLLTLTGSGGTGKTRLSLQVGAELVEAYEHGVFFVDLSVARETFEVVSATAQVLDVRESMEQNRNLSDILKNYLQRKCVLLILDNFEQVIEAGTLVAELLASSPELTVIVTSREPLHIRGEREFPVPPLGLPSRSDDQSVERLTQYESVLLFIDRATAVSPNFMVTNENAPAVAEICIRLDGLPLAIELAAARTKILPPQTLMERLSDRLKLLKGGARDLPMRQQTLQSAIDWSYELLDEEEKILFARLSVFRGGCTLEAAESVCAIDENLDFDIIDGLSSLVDKSLVRQTVKDGDPRFWMLETVGEYAQEKLKITGSINSVKSSHAGFFLELAEEAEPKLRGPDQMLFLDRLETEFVNLGTAIEWLLENHTMQDALRMSGALYWFWFRYGHFAEGRKWLERSLSTGDDSKPTTVYAKALHALAQFLFFASDLERSAELERKSVVLWRQIGNKKELAISLADLGRIESWIDQSRAGRPLIDEAIGHARKLGNPWVTGYALLMYHISGAGTIEKCVEAIDLFCQVGDFWGISWAQHSLAGEYLDHNEYGKAKLLYKKSLDGARELKDRFLLTNALRRLAHLCFDEKDYQQAVNYEIEALQIAFDIGAIRNIVGSLLLFGRVSRAQGNHGRAAILMGAYTVQMEAIRKITYPEKIAAMFSDYTETFASEWQNGQVMTLDQAVDYAINTQSDSDK